jgi:hypothetical protein
MTKREGELRIIKIIKKEIIENDDNSAEEAKK